MDFVKKFRDLALDCYVEQDEYALVDIYVNNIITEYRVHLENLSINQFSKLIEAARRTSGSVKITSPNRRGWKDERTKAPQALVTIERKSALHRGHKILIRLRGLVLSTRHEEGDLVRAEMGETDLTKREELVQPLKIFREQEMAHHLFHTKEVNSETTLRCLVLTKSSTLYLINGLLMA